MRNWEKEVSHRLSDPRFASAEREAISRELAGYLEDLCNEARSGSLDESAAIEFALNELHQDPRLGPRLRRARREGNMNDRTKRFWLPGVSMLLASAGCLAILQIVGLQADFTPLWVRGGAATPNSIYVPLAIYWPWLSVLPFLGAAGVYWSRRAGGSRSVQASVGFFSAFVFLAILLLVLAFSFIFGGLLSGVPATQTLFPEFMGALLSWVVIPGIALLLGVLPFLAHSRDSENLVAADCE